MQKGISCKHDFKSMHAKTLLVQSPAHQLRTQSTAWPGIEEEEVHPSAVFLPLCAALPHPRLYFRVIQWQGQAKTARLSQRRAISPPPSSCPKSSAFGAFASPGRSTPAAHSNSSKERHELNPNNLINNLPIVLLWEVDPQIRCLRAEPVHP